MSIVVIIIYDLFFNASKAIVNHPQFYQFYGWYSINHQSTWVVYDIALLTRYPILSCHCFFSWTQTASTTRSMGMVDKKSTKK